MRDFLFRRVVFSFCFSTILVLVIVVQAKSPPVSPLEGRLVFEEKGCVKCHSIHGAGGNVGADFGAKKFFGSGYELAADMWNHSSEMILKMREMGIKKTDFSPEDFQRLQDFLYMLRYLGEHGSAANGKKLFQEKKCNACHSIGDPKSKMVHLDKMKFYASPLYLAQSMWNHSPKMLSQQKSSGVSRPFFKVGEMSDIAAYLEEVSSLKKREQHYMYPGNPVEGEKLFQTKRCAYCHVEKNIGPDLKFVSFGMTATEIAGMMWNHAEKMVEHTEKLKMAWPAFKGSEMANLVSYLFFMNQPKVSGSSEQGKSIFEKKGCAKCHQGGASVAAPVLPGGHHFQSEVEFFSALWNHVPKMEDILFAKGQKLPTLTDSDVKSLFLFLKKK